MLLIDRQDHCVLLIDRPDHCALLIDRPDHCVFLIDRLRVQKRPWVFFKSYQVHSPSIRSHQHLHTSLLVQPACVINDKTQTMPTSTHAVPMSSSAPLTRLLAVWVECFLFSHVPKKPASSSFTIVHNVNLPTWFTIYCYAILKVDKVSRVSCFIVPSSFSPGPYYPLLELKLYIICLSTIYYVLYNVKIIQFSCPHSLLVFQNVRLWPNCMICVGQYHLRSTYFHTRGLSQWENFHSVWRTRSPSIFIFTILV